MTILSVLTACLWTFLVFRLTSRHLTHTFRRFNSPWKRALRCGLTQTGIISLLTFCIALFSALFTAKESFPAGPLGFERGPSLIWAMGGYGILTAIVTGLTAYFTSFSNERTCLRATYIVLGLSCWPVFLVLGMMSH